MKVDQDIVQQTKIAAIFMLQFYKVTTGTMLTLFVPQACYELYQIIKKSLVETHELNQEVSISEEEVYLFDGSKITYYPKKLFRLLSPRKIFRLLKGDF